MSPEKFCLKNVNLPLMPAFPLAEGSLIVGRDASCDIVLAAISVSRRHAELVVTRDAVTVRDLDSRNGTFIDDTPIQSASIEVGQRVRFGGIELEVIRASAQPNAEAVDVDTESVHEFLGATFTEIERLDLSAAERRVLENLLMGYSEKEIARRLRISPHTVHSHVRKVYQAVGVHSRAELLSKFIKFKEGLG